MKKLYIIFGVVILLVFTIFYYRQHPLSAKLTIKQTEFIIDLAITDTQKTTGLSGRKNLAPRHGMLFIYEHKDLYPFWMKDMQFPLDFVWIDENVVVDITEHVQIPDGINFHVVKPNKPVNKILELNAGDITTYNIQIGDTILFNK